MTPKTTSHSSQVTDTAGLREIAERLWEQLLCDHHLKRSQGIAAIELALQEAVRAALAEPSEAMLARVPQFEDNPKRHIWTAMAECRLKQMLELRERKA